jgi:hypothetical protein
LFSKIYAGAEPIPGIVTGKQLIFAIQHGKANLAITTMKAGYLKRPMIEQG